MGRRREERIKVSFPVKVWGMDSMNKPFMQSSHAVDVTRLGARLTSLHCVDKLGDVLGLQYGNLKARYKITWIGSAGTPEAGEVGIQCIEPDKNIWGASLPRRGKHDDIYVVPSETMRFRDDPMGQGGYQGATGSAATSSASGAKDNKKRQHPRYPANGTVEVLPEGAALPVWATLNDISINGCYAETVSPLPAHTRARITVQTLAHTLHVKGVVRTSHPGVGMGLTFTHMPPEEKTHLDAIMKAAIDEIANNSVTMNIGDDAPSRVAGMRNISTPEVSTTAEKQRALAAAAPSANVYTLSRSASAPAATAAATATAPRSGIASRINGLNIEMKELHHTLMNDKVDARVLREFRTAMEHARATSVLLQQWVQKEDSGEDPYHLLHDLHIARIRMLTEQIHDLAMDIDAQDVQSDAQGIEKLSASVAMLNMRLNKFGKR